MSVARRTATLRTLWCFGSLFALAAAQVDVDEGKSFTFSGKGSYASFTQEQFAPKGDETSKDSLTLFLRTRESFGLLALLATEGDFLAITLDAGYVTLHFGLGEDTQALVQARSRVNDAAWHKIVITRNGLLASITIDNRLEYFVTAEGAGGDTLSLPDTLFVGGVPDPDTFEEWPRGKYEPFRGCLTDLKYNGKALKFGSSTSVNVTADCTSDPGVCNPNPCVNPTPSCVDIWNDFTCACRPGFEGADCEVNLDDCKPDSCMNGGTCVDGFNDVSCRCPPEWHGEICQTRCDQGNCVGRVVCDKEDGGNRKCLACEPGWFGIACDRRCPPSNCGVPATTCDQMTGAVDCPTCEVGRFGSRALDTRLLSDCELPCPATSACLDPVECQKETGHPRLCTRCARGLFSQDCSRNCEQGDCVGVVACDLDGGARSCTACKPGRWGESCTERCDQGDCLGVVQCKQDTGKGRQCSLCRAGTWGSSCGKTCRAENCLGEIVCNQQSGETLRCNRCKQGYFGPDCSARCTESFCVEKPTCDIDTGVSFCPTCEDGYWGVADKATRQGDCSKECKSSTCDSVTTCDRVSGASFSCSSCLPGFFGPLCDERCRQGDCVGTVVCNKKDGRGRQCERCRDGFWGPTCAKKCKRGKCVGAVRCDQETGESRLCQSCDAGFWGRDCTETCAADNCKGKPVCEQDTGQVLECRRCRVGFWSSTCDAECTRGQCATPVTCDQDSGSDRACSTCNSGFYGAGCGFACPRGKCVGDVTCKLDLDSNNLQRNCTACIEGFTGPDCEEDLDECAAEEPVCLNGGVCRNEFGSYRCQCPEGLFGGRNCQIKLNGCVVPTGGPRCLYDGNCTDVPGGFSCSCQPGHVGDRCQRQTTVSLAHKGSLELPSLKSAQIDVQFAFRTTEAYGTLLLNRGDGDDYLLLELVAGNLLLQLGYGTSATQFELLVGDGYLNDGAFHDVRLGIVGRKVELAVDGGACGSAGGGHVCQDTRVVLGDGSAVLDVGRPLEVGLPRSLDDDAPVSARLHHKGGYLGCIRELVVSGVEVNFLEAARAENVLPGCRVRGQCSDSPCLEPATCQTGIFGEAICACPFGLSGTRCDTPTVPVSFLGENRIQLDFDGANHELTATTDVSFRFRTRAESGTLLLAEGGSSSDDFILMDLVDGRVRATVRHGKRVVSAVSPEAMNDAEWHTAEFHRGHENTFFTLAVNGSAAVRGVFASEWTRLDLTGGVVTLGGLRARAEERIAAVLDPSPGGALLGCMQDLRVRGRPVNLLEPNGFTRSAFGGLSVGCTSTDVCADNGPCPVGKSTCIDKWNSAECECFENFGPPGNCLKNTSVPDPCLSNPCQNGAACSSTIEVDPLTADTTSEFVCECPAGFVGYLCQTECSCVNGGICSAVDPASHDRFDHTCECPVQYTGLDCSVDVDECASDRWPCKQGEFCVESNVTAETRCDPLNNVCQGSWAGYSCIAIAPCPRETFEVLPATLKSDRVCQAATPACDQSVSFESQPLRLKRDRVCSPLRNCSVGQFESNAATATSDRKCKTLSACRPGEVETVPPTATSDRVCVPCECKNQGKCLVKRSRGDSFRITCDCPTGYNGTLCELEGCFVGACPDRDCVEDAAVGHRCICPPGLTGDDCLLPDTLESCERQGFCTAPNECSLSDSGGITCICPESREGCETQVLVAGSGEEAEGRNIVPIVVGLCVAIALLMVIVIVVVIRRRRQSKDLEPVEPVEPTPELFPADRMI